MKIINNTLLSALLLVSLVFTTSCKKQLDSRPYDAVDEQTAFKTPQDFDNAVRGMYRPTLFFASSNGSDRMIMGDLLADNLISSGVGRSTHLTDNRWLYNAETTSSLFVNAYVVIRRANAVLANIDNGVLSSSGAIKETYRAEALCIRAWMHFEVARLFCKIPSANVIVPGAINPTEDLGIPYVATLDPKALPARESIADVYKKISDDLIAAETAIGNTNTVESGRWNRAAVSGFLAKVYLYMGEWQKAVNAANRSLGINNGIGSIATFPSIWTDATATGVLFKIKILDADRLSPGVSYSQPSGTTYNSEFFATYDFYNMFANNDVRKNTYVKIISYSGADRLHIMKYVGRATGNRNVVDVKVLRAADVLLIRAEANARLNNTTAAVNDLNTLRMNRYTGYTNYIYSDQATLIADILKERRFELAFEGERFFDLKRTYQSVQRDANYGDRADGGGRKFPSNAVQLPATDHRMQLPFPQDEINVNTNFKQNPGY